LDNKLYAKEMIRMSTKQNKVIVCRFIDEAYNKRNLTVGDELLATNVVLHTSNVDIKGREGWKQYASGFLAGFSDIVISVEDTIAEGDKVVANWIWVWHPHRRTSGHCSYW
jgi:predicted SnoaL-like aldol condensation-catalyzing enzyme